MVSDASFAESLYGLRRRGVRFKLKQDSSVSSESNDSVQLSGLRRRQKVLSVAFLVVSEFLLLAFIMQYKKSS